MIMQSEEPPAAAFMTGPSSDGSQEGNIMNEISAFFAENAAPIVWIIITVILGLVEALTVDLVCIWFALGALVTAIAAGFGAPFVAQIVIFVAVSALSMIFTRKFVVGVLKVKKTPTNADSVVGQEGIVIEDIDNVAETGRVRLAGLDWTARSADGEDIHKGETVKVKAIQGVKLMVAKVKVLKEVK